MGNSLVTLQLAKIIKANSKRYAFFMFDGYKDTAVPNGDAGGGIKIGVGL